MISISIIIVNYNSWTYLSGCLESFIKYKPKAKHEIIVVDNDSQGGKLEEFSNNFPQVTFIKNSGNNGFANGCNLGAHNAQGEFLLFLNPDAVLTSSNAIDSMFEFAKNNPSVGITSCRKIDPKGVPEREMTFANPWLIISWIRAIYKLTNNKKIKKKFPAEDDIWYPEWVAGSVVTISNDLFYQIGRWSQEHYWMYSEDFDLCKKARNINKEIALLRNVEIKHAHGGSSRRNLKTTAISKSETVTSSHVFVQIHTKGLNRIALHVAITLKTLVSWLLRTLLALPFFWNSSLPVNFFTLVAIIQYYVGVIIRGTWKSNRLNLNE